MTNATAASCTREALTDGTVTWNGTRVKRK
jgi:hypothetical protein